MPKNNPGEVVITGENGEQRVLRSTPDWSEAAVNSDHLWIPTSASGDLCYLAEAECTRYGSRMKCSGCRIVAHISCIPQMKFPCRPTFWDGDVRQYRENTNTVHHWVHRRSQTGKCQNCYKSFQSKLSFGSKEIVAISCSWCKEAFHNKDSCFNMERYKEHCSLGVNSDITVPPSWIVKLPGRDNFKSSLRKSPRKKGSIRRIKKGEPGSSDRTRSFIVKPIPTCGSRPLIVFLNPKSGGNQGVKLMAKFQWLLNPRQVFDLTQGGPKAGLEMFRKVPNLIILACGGDGTAGWVLSVLDQIQFSPQPPVGVLPLGTGNDLARTLGWGGGYTDEPLSKIIQAMGKAETVYLDRWQLKVTKNTVAPAISEEVLASYGSHPVKDNLPLNVVNNYFSFGVDADIALQFHEAREAHPERFNSRLRNKMFYGQCGGKDLLLRRWKDLTDYVTIECDGKDITPKLRSEKCHAVLFLNIPSYGGGTRPWSGHAATDDGFIEVVGLTTYTLPLLQAGAHGCTLAQCQTARIVTHKIIPMQVDGEACRLAPSVIELSLLNKAPVLAKSRYGLYSSQSDSKKTVRSSVVVKRITMTEYERNHYDKEALQESAQAIGEIDVSQEAVLEHVRKLVNELLEATNQKMSNAGGIDWCFIDCCTAERVFRVDTGQEHLHYLTDISNDELYILDPEGRNSLDGPNGGTMSDDANDAANREIMNSYRNDYKKNRGKQGEGMEQNIVPVPVKATHLEKASGDIVKAAHDGDLKKVMEMHSSGISLLSTNDLGETALHCATSQGHREVVKYLLASAPQSILDMVENERGHSALHKASLAKQRTISCMLVAAGASLLLLDKGRSTARQLATQAGDSDLAIYLESQENFLKSNPNDPETNI